MLLNFADLVLEQKLIRIIQGNTSIITQKVVNLQNIIAVKISWFTVSGISRQSFFAECNDLME